LPARFTEGWNLNLRLHRFEDGDTLDQFLEQYPSVTRDLAIAAMEEARLSLVARLK
jgi:hypothetical protein